MTPHKRRAILFGAMTAMLAVVALWNVNWMLQQRDDARHALEDLVACRQLAGAIESLRAQPALAATEDMGIQELGQRIEAASRLAKLDGSTLEGVFPQSTRRVGNSPYLQKPTSLVLRGVSLQQLATFLYHLTDQSGLSARDIRLRTPRGDSAGDLWDVETTLTYLIYSPPLTRQHDQ